MTHADINARLVEYFVRSKITQKAFAEKADVTEVTISAIMQNKNPRRKVQAKTAERILATIEK